MSGQNIMRLNTKLQVASEAERAQPRPLRNFIPAEGEHHYNITRAAQIV
jgi:hypothetical protein